MDTQFSSVEYPTIEIGYIVQFFLRLDHNRIYHSLRSDL